MIIVLKMILIFITLSFYETLAHKCLQTLIDYIVWRNIKNFQEYIFGASSGG